jgi:hypothetical protein
MCCTVRKKLVEFLIKQHNRQHIYALPTSGGFSGGMGGLVPGPGGPFRGPACRQNI